MFRNLKLWFYRKRIHNLNVQRELLMDWLNEVRRVHGKSSHLQKRLQEVTAELMRIGL